MDAPRASGMARPRLVGIVNLTPDSFSDGGLYCDPAGALAHARDLAEAGADCIELGPASSAPDAKPVSAAEEIERLRPVLPALLPELTRRGTALGVDSYLPQTQRYALSAGARWIGDIQGFPEPALYAELGRSGAELVVMHSVQRRGPATRERFNAREIPGEIERFFESRIRALEAGGVAPEQIILDPGMGFFLGSDPEASRLALRAIAELRRRFERPVLISVSRKSFLAMGTDRPPAERGPATLAAELFAADQGVDWIRTHDVRALRDALRVHRWLS